MGLLESPLHVLHHGGSVKIICMVVSIDFHTQFCCYCTSLMQGLTEQSPTVLFKCRTLREVSDS